MHNCAVIYECTPLVDASELEGGGVNVVSPCDFLPWVLFSCDKRYVFRTQIDYNAVDILRVRVDTVLI